MVKVKATIDGKTISEIRQVASVEAFRTVNPTLHFGLGDAATVDEMVITWPSGIVQTLKNVKADQFMILRE